MIVLSKFHYRLVLAGLIEGLPGKLYAHLIDEYLGGSQPTNPKTIQRLNAASQLAKKRIMETIDIIKNNLKTQEPNKYGKLSDSQWSQITITIASFILNNVIKREIVLFVTTYYVNQGPDEDINKREYTVQVTCEDLNKVVEVLTNFYKYKFSNNFPIKALTPSTSLNELWNAVNSFEEQRKSKLYSTSDNPYNLEGVQTILNKDPYILLYITNRKSMNSLFCKNSNWCVSKDLYPEQTEEKNTFTHYGGKFYVLLKSHKPYLCFDFSQNECKQVDNEVVTKEQSEELAKVIVDNNLQDLASNIVQVAMSHSNPYHNPSYEDTSEFSNVGNAILKFSPNIKKSIIDKISNTDLYKLVGHNSNQGWDEVTKVFNTSMHSSLSEPLPNTKYLTIPYSPLFESTSSKLVHDELSAPKTKDNNYSLIKSEIRNILETYKSVQNGRIADMFEGNIPILQSLSSQLSDTIKDIHPKFKSFKTKISIYPPAYVSYHYPSLRVVVKISPTISTKYYSNIPISPSFALSASTPGFIEFDTSLYKNILHSKDASNIILPGGMKLDFKLSDSNQILPDAFIYHLIKNIHYFITNSKELIEVYRDYNLFGNHMEKLEKTLLNIKDNAVATHS